MCRRRRWSLYISPFTIPDHGHQHFGSAFSFCSPQIIKDNQAYTSGAERRAEPELMEVYKIPPITVVAGHGQISISFFSTCFTKSLETVIREAGERRKREKRGFCCKVACHGEGRNAILAPLRFLRLVRRKASARVSLSCQIFGSDSCICSENPVCIRV